MRRIPEWIGVVLGVAAICGGCGRVPEATPDSGSGGAACEPNEQYCDGANAVTCGSSGEVASTMDCGAAGCVSGVCNSCTPSTTSCDGDTLVVCNDAGTVQSATPCSLGCGASPSPHCKALDPLYGVPVPSGSPSDLMVIAQSSLELGTCSANSVKLSLGSRTVYPPAEQIALVQQIGAPPICVVQFGNIEIEKDQTLYVINTAATGYSLSLQAVGDIKIAGTIAFGNSAPGPRKGNEGATGMTAAGHARHAGAGGGGAAYPGGAGGRCTDCTGSVLGGSGGTAVTSIASVLPTGSRGGGVYGGRGGGGLQIVSLTAVSLAETARINLNGGGGHGDQIYLGVAGGGGSGGTLVIEAPVVRFASGAIASANGGGGAGGCLTVCDDTGDPDETCYHSGGSPGQLSSMRASGAVCPSNDPMWWGGPADGGYEANGSASPSSNGEDCIAGALGLACGGGGGSSGFMVLRGRSEASVVLAADSVVSPPPTIGAVNAN